MASCTVQFKVFPWQLIRFYSILVFKLIVHISCFAFWGCCYNNICKQFDLSIVYPYQDLIHPNKIMFIWVTASVDTFCAHSLNIHGNSGVELLVELWQSHEVSGPVKLAWMNRRWGGVGEQNSCRFYPLWMVGGHKTEATWFWLVDTLLTFQDMAWQVTATQRTSTPQRAHWGTNLSTLQLSLTFPYHRGTRRLNWTVYHHATCEMK